MTADEQTKILRLLDAAEGPLFTAELLLTKAGEAELARETMARYSQLRSICKAVALLEPTK